MKTHLGIATAIGLLESLSLLDGAQGSGKGGFLGFPPQEQQYCDKLARYLNQRLSSLIHGRIRYMDHIYGILGA